jgi:cytochrome c
MRRYASHAGIQLRHRTPIFSTTKDRVIPRETRETRRRVRQHKEATMFPKHFFANAVFAALAASSFTSIAATAVDDGATAEQATAMVKKGVAFIKANGNDKGYAEISSKTTQFKDRDLYLVVYGLDGVVRAHGANEKMIGRNLIDLKDVDGKAFVKERVDLGSSKGTFWQNYKFTNPTNKKIEAKRMYCERLEDAVVCGGIYD